MNANDIALGITYAIHAECGGYVGGYKIVGVDAEAGTVTVMVEERHCPVKIPATYPIAGVMPLRDKLIQIDAQRAANGLRPLNNAWNR